MTYEELTRANSKVITTNIQGKQYAEVNQRIKAFRMLYPEGFIRTQIVSNENGICIIHAEVGEGERILATGTAYEKEGSTFINKTSYIENCETSAVGRALGMLGIGIDTSVASAEEVGNAIAQQKALAEKTTQEKRSEILASYPPDQLKSIAEFFGHTSIDQLTEAEVDKVLVKRRAKK